jgi:hypothetical protein
MAAKAATTPAGGAFSLAVSAGAAEADVPSQKFSLGGDITPPAKPSAPVDKSSYEPVPTMEKRKMRIVDAEGKVHEREVSVPVSTAKATPKAPRPKQGQEHALAKRARQIQRPKMANAFARPAPATGPSTTGRPAELARRGKGGHSRHARAARR